MGPIWDSFPTGSKYYISLMDDFSCHTIILFMKMKDKTLKKIKKYLHWMTNKFVGNPKILKVNNGIKYINNTMGNILRLISKYDLNI